MFSPSGLCGKGFIIAIVLAIVAFLMLSLFGAYAGYAKISKIRKGTIFSRDSITSSFYLLLIKSK